MIDYIVYCPSYKRSKLATTHALMLKDNFCFVVRESEQHLYAPLDRRMLVIPEGAVHDISTTRNYILDHSESANIVMVDDDISKFIHLYKRNRQTLVPNQVHKFIVDMFEMALSMGTGLWGCGIVPDPIAYSINNPFAFRVPILGPFCGHKVDHLRYDIALNLKEDYDFFLQKISHYGFCIRSNFFSYQCDHLKLAGGCQSYRTIEKERAQQEALMLKWGSEIVRYNEKNAESVNMRLRL
jgi:hypothetical protein